MADIHFPSRRPAPESIDPLPSGGRPLVLSVSIIAGALVLCALILVSAVARIKAASGTIRVTGSARRQVRSDFIIWQGRITRQAPTLAQAFQGVRADEQKVTSYLTSQGMYPSEISPAPIETKALATSKAYDGTVTWVTQDAEAGLFHKPKAYVLTENIEVKSTRVALVERVSRSSTDLIQSGVVFSSQTPQYVYRDMSALKLQILKEAADNAHARAESIAACGGDHAGSLRYAHMGVMQVTPAYVDEDVSANGTEDTTSLDKKVTAIVSAGYNVR